MENIEKSDIWKGVDFWMTEIEKAGVKDKLNFFNDILTGKEAPAGYGDPELVDVVLDGRKCDIYHTDKERGDSGSRVFIHIKE